MFVCVASWRCPEFPLFLVCWREPMKDAGFEPAQDNNPRILSPAHLTTLAPPQCGRQDLNLRKTKVYSLLRAAHLAALAPPLWCRYLDATPGLTPESGAVLLYTISTYAPAGIRTRVDAVKGHNP